MCFTETWFHSCFPDSSAAVPGFWIIRVDRDVERSGKKKGGGCAVCQREAV